MLVILPSGCYTAMPTHQSVTVSHELLCDQYCKKSSSWQRIFWTWQIATQCYRCLCIELRVGVLRNACARTVTVDGHPLNGRACTIVSGALNLEHNRTVNKWKTISGHLLQCTVAVYVDLDLTFLSNRSVFSWRVDSLYPKLLVSVEFLLARCEEEWQGMDCLWWRMQLSLTMISQAN